MRRILLLSVVLCVTEVLHAQSTKNFIDQPYIEVSGSADTLVMPDEIYIQISLSEKDTKDKVSLETLENQMADALKSLGIDVAKDLVVEDIASNFKVYLLKGKDVLKSKQYVLKVKDAETAAKVFMKLEDLGISNTSIDHVGISNKNQINRMLLSQAAADAYANAVALTDPLHQKIGKAIEISSVNPRYLSTALSGKVSGVIVAGYKKSVAGAEPVPDISFKKISMTAAVSAKFILQ
jgi:uncharacterized protein YggE